MTNAQVRVVSAVPIRDASMSPATATVTDHERFMFCGIGRRVSPCAYGACTAIADKGFQVRSKKQDRPPCHFVSNQTKLLDAGCDPISTDGIHQGGPGKGLRYC